MKMEHQCGTKLFPCDFKDCLELTKEIYKLYVSKTEYESLGLNKMFKGHIATFSDNHFKRGNTFLALMCPKHFKMILKKHKDEIVWGLT